MLAKNISKSLPGDPLKLLFLAHLEDEDYTSFGAKTAIIQQFTHELEELLNNCENQSTFLHWASIFSGFSASLALTGATVLTPILGLVVAATAASSSGVVIGGSYLRHQKMSETSKKLQRYSIALKSTAGNNWAKLWHIAGTELFLESLVVASKGHINHEGRLIKHDGRNPLATALDYCSERMGISRTELIERTKAIGAQTQLQDAPTQLQDSTPTKLLQNAPTKLQQTPSPDRAKDYAPDYEQNAVSIIDNLVLSAENQSLGGCVIIAAPGAGKTTFLGTAWGRLKTHHGKKIQSLAVVVKKSDLAFFKSFATTALCIKDNPVNAVVEIIKFIDTGMKEGKITRLFLDDFLTMNIMLENALKGIYLEPNSYYISEKKELGFVPLSGHLQASLNEAWLVGREYNLCLWVSSHSPNLDALPFCGSRDSRSVGDIIFLAKNSKREFLELALSNAHLISNSNKRQELKQQLDQLDTGDSPIVLSNISNWTLGVVPEFIRDEYKGYRSQCWESADSVKDAVADDNIQDDTRQQLETFFKLPSAYTPALSKIATMILEIIKSGNPPMRFDAIRKSRKWGEKTPISAVVREGIDELLSKKIISGDNENGFTVIS